MLLRVQAQRAASINYTAHRHTNKMNTSKSRWINNTDYARAEMNKLDCLHLNNQNVPNGFLQMDHIHLRSSVFMYELKERCKAFTEMLLWVDREHMCMLVKLAVQENKKHTGTISDCKNLRAGCGATSQTKSLSACKLQESQAVNRLSVRLAGQRLKTSYSGCTHFSAKSRTWQHMKQLLQDEVYWKTQTGTKSVFVKHLSVQNLGKM